MNAKMLSKVIEVENRVNTICKCLVLGEATHFNVAYSNHNVEITAFADSCPTACKLADLMRIYAEPEDEVKQRSFTDKDKDFWTSEMTISLD